MTNRIGFQGITRRSLLKNTAVAAVTSLLARRGFAVATPNFQPTPGGQLTQASLAVTSGTVGTVPAAFVGLSYSKEKMLGTLFTGSNSSLIGVLQRLGPSILRIGGSSVDQSVWQPNGSGGQQGYVATKDVDNLADFLNGTGWSCLYGVNLAGAIKGATTPGMAADEIAYVAEKLGPALVGVEIGNEPDLYGNPGHLLADYDWSFDKFLSLWNEFRTAIVRDTPGVAITGPADGGTPTGWTIPFGKVVTNRNINLLTQHHYQGSAKWPTSTVEELLLPDPHLINDLANLNSFSAANRIPFRISECNSYDHNSPRKVNISSTYATALWGLDFMFTCALGGAAGVNFMAGGDSNGYSPIRNGSDQVVQICPLYYAMLMFTLAGTGTLLETQLSVGGLNVTGYAVESPAGGMNLIVINKESSQNLQLTIQLPNSYDSASLMQMTQRYSDTTIPDLRATKGVTIQSAAVELDGAFNPNTAYTLIPNETLLNCYVPALSAVLIQTT